MPVFSTLQNGLGGGGGGGVLGGGVPGGGARCTPAVRRAARREARAWTALLRRSGFLQDGVTRGSLLNGEWRRGPHCGRN